MQNHIARLNWLVAFILFIALMIIVFSCGGSKKEKTEVPKEGSTLIFAVYINRDSTRVASSMLRQITKVVRYDSSQKKDIIVVDTLWGKATVVPLIDPITKKPVLDSLGNPKADPVTQYILIPKDSVVWRIENVPVDSLLKKR